MVYAELGLLPVVRLPDVTFMCKSHRGFYKADTGVLYSFIRPETLNPKP